MNRVTLTIEDIAADEARGRWAEPIARDEYEKHHYRATLHYQGRSARYRYTTGAGWERPPVAREVLESVLSDSAMLEGADDVDAAVDAIVDAFGDDVEPRPRRLAHALLDGDRKTRRLLGDEYKAAMEDSAGWAWSHTEDPPDWIAKSDRPRAGSTWAGRIGTTRDGEPVRVEVQLVDRNDKGPELSISGSTPHSGGQIRDVLDELETFESGWNRDKVDELGRIWDAWHLNGMNSACSHQRALGWTYDEHHGNDPENRYEGDACPECGYHIGSAWLYEPLPAHVLEWLERELHIRPPVRATV